jgi:hypothetical protein
MSDVCLRIFLTRPQYADRLNIDFRSLQKLVDSGAIEPADQTLGGELLFSPQSLQNDITTARAIRRNK